MLVSWVRWEIYFLLHLTVEYNRRRGLSATALSFGTKLISSTNDQFANVAPLLVILC